MNSTKRTFWRSLALTGLAASLGAACSFPEHNFIDDSEFYASGGTGAGASGGTAGQGGSGNNTSGGNSGSSAGGASGSSGQGGTAAEGGVGGTTGGNAGSAGMGATGGTTGGTGGMAGNAGSSGGTGLEDCTNGVDDDGDNKADCEDTKCQSVGYQCLALPDGWDGPVALYEGPNTSVTCEGNYATGGPNGGKNLNAPNAMCSACSCGAPNGAITCHFPDLSVYENASCGGGYRWTFAGADLETNGVQSGDCFGAQDPFSGPNGELPSAASTTAPPTTGGSCVPSGGAPTTPSPSWNTNARSCALSGGIAPTGCGTNSCVPPTAGGFNLGACVYKDGDQSCPTGSFSFKHLYYTDSNDSRDCTACTCGTPTGVTCNGAKFEIWSGSSCSGTADGTVSTPGSTCAPVSNSTDKSFKYTVGTASGGTCTPAGGQPTGGATPTNPVTFCCTK